MAHKMPLIVFGGSPTPSPLKSALVGRALAEELNCCRSQREADKRTLKIKMWNIIRRQLSPDASHAPVHPTAQTQPRSLMLLTTSSTERQRAATRGVVPLLSAKPFTRSNAASTNSSTVSNVSSRLVRAPDFA